MKTLRILLLAGIPLANAAEPGASPGSLFAPAGRWADLASDFRAARPGDVVTIVVSESASALARGTTTSSRKSDASGAVTALLGRLSPAGGLANLAKAGSEQQLQGQGQTSRETTISTNLAARVVEVLPNGTLLIEGRKDVWVNAERQVVTVRGIARWNDVGPANQIRSERLANLEIQVQGRGVINDAVRRPHLLHRILLGVLPF